MDAAVILLTTAVVYLALKKRLAIYAAFATTDNPAGGLVSAVSKWHIGAQSATTSK